MDADYKLLRKGLEKYLNKAYVETSNSKAREALFGNAGVRRVLWVAWQPLENGRRVSDFDCLHVCFQARAVEVESLAQESESLTRSNTMVSSYIESGMSMLASLQSQGATLKVLPCVSIVALVCIVVPVCACACACVCVCVCVCGKVSPLSSLCVRYVCVLAATQGAHRRVLDIAATLGMSNNLMNVIKRRTTTDKYIVYSGMVLILVLFYLVMVFARR